MKLDMNKINLVLDIGLALVFAVEMEEHFLGLANHELLGLMFGAMFLVHIALHWRWILSVTTQLFRKLVHESRFNYLLNLALLIALGFTTLTGILISRTLGLNLGLEREAMQTWEQLHKQASSISLIIVGLHVGMHWKWILTSVRKYLFSGRFIRGKSSIHAIKNTPAKA